MNSSVSLAQQSIADTSLFVQGWWSTLPSDVLTSTLSTHSYMLPRFRLRNESTRVVKSLLVTKHKPYTIVLIPGLAVLDKNYWCNVCLFDLKALCSIWDCSAIWTSYQRFLSTTTEWTLRITTKLHHWSQRTRTGHKEPSHYNVLHSRTQTWSLNHEHPALRIPTIRGKSPFVRRRVQSRLLGACRYR